MLAIKGKLDNYVVPTNTTKHVHEREKRMMLEEAQADRVATFLCDSGTRHGDEAHVIFSDGTVRIYNIKKQRKVTTLIARPQQIKRYFESIGALAPAELIKLARQHQQEKLNEL